MGKRQFKAQASSSKVASETAFGGFGAASSSSLLSYPNQPPDLASITDSNMIVAFKNLLKKDSITKSKGLEDLRAYVQSHPYEQDGGTEQPVLEAWVKLYPRMSIDNSRRVRELSHNLQYELLKSARKRMEKHIPSVVGAWLAGTYDRDRVVSRAAEDGIKSFLDTEDKVVSFWRRCQTQILEYAQSSILETPQTLSDERTVSEEDMQAKYDRVVSGSLSLVLNLLTKLDERDINKCQDAYHQFLSGNKTLWKFIAGSDAVVRKTTAQLLLVCLDKETEIMENDAKIIGNAFIVEGLRSSQVSSAVAFLQALTKLTTRIPLVWTTAYSGKKPPISKISQFIEKGSQGGSPDYWQTLGILLLKLPSGILPSDLEGAVEFLKIFRDGIANRLEVRTNSQAAWKCYCEVVRHFQALFADTKPYQQLLVAAIYPVFQQFLHPATENSRWSMGNNIAGLTLAFNLCLLPNDKESAESLRMEWQRLAQLFASSMAISLPEQSKEFDKSQSSVLAEGYRWFSLQAEILKEKTNILAAESGTDFLAASIELILNKALELLKNRNGKPYGAAGTLDSALRLVPGLISASKSTLLSITSFLEAQLPTLIISPSSSYLIASLNVLRGLPGQEQTFKRTWSAAIESLLTLPESSAKTTAMHLLISSGDVTIFAQHDEGLQEYLSTAILRTLEGDQQNWPVLESGLAFNSFNDDTSNRMVKMMISGLEAAQPDHAIRVLELVAQKQPQLLLRDQMTHVTIMARLLALTESPDSEIVSRARALKSVIADTSASDTDSNMKQPAILAIIRESLENASPQSLTIDTLVHQAESFLESGKDDMSSHLFPSSQKWYQALQPLLEYPPNPAVSLLSGLGGAASLVSVLPSSTPARPTRDARGYSIAFRMALYTSKILRNASFPATLPIENQAAILFHFCVTIELANDQFSLQERNMLWSSLEDPDMENEVEEFIAAAQREIMVILGKEPGWRDVTSDHERSPVRILIQSLVDKSKGRSPTAYYAARALSNILSNLVELHGWQAVGGEDWLASVDSLKSSTPNVLTAVALLSGLAEGLESSKIVNTLCNRLVSDAAGTSKRSEKTLDTLVLLNSSLAVYEQESLPVAKNRLVFAAKQITSFMNNGTDMGPGLVAEACRALQLLLPAIKDVYGEFWETTLKFCASIWDTVSSGDVSDRELPPLHASLKLIILLEGLDDANDDLESLLDGFEYEISGGLVRLLALPRIKENQPWRIFDELLGRRISKMGLNHLKDTSDLYPLVASEFELIQSASFNILHRAIPSAQQQLSVDVIIEQRDAQLPEELLSLLLEAPSINDLPDDLLAQFPTTVRTYLFSWHLVYDFYTNASDKVRSDYTESLKSENYITPFLDFLVDVLGHSVGQPINLDKEHFTATKIQSYSLALAASEDPSEHMHWLLCHLYYLCLTRTPTLAKAWWLACKSRQTQIAVLTWTEKYFSPLVISSVLDDVALWASQQEPPADDEKELIVKVAKKTREVYAGCEVDDMQMQIVIRLPATYPLEGVKVEGVNRVAVSEKKWQSWLMITQGVITFSNSSLPAGLSTFVRNVRATLKGQTECAICYSLISADKKMPDKRCQTCKNLFHSGCLFKWFASSNQSTCPLCRNVFSFGTDVGTRARRRGGPEE